MHKAYSPDTPIAGPVIVFDNAGNKLAAFATDAEADAWIEDHEGLPAMRGALSDLDISEGTR